MRSIRTALVAVLFAALAHGVAPGVAGAFTSVPGHADVKVKASRNVGGKVRGCTLSFCVRMPSAGYGSAFPGLLNAGAEKTLMNGNRAAVINPTLGQLRIPLRPVAVPQANVVVPVTEEIDYDAHGLNSGDKLYLITAWPALGAETAAHREDPKFQTPHVYGTITSNDPAFEITLP